MPDWTYHPLRGPAGALLGTHRSRRAALRALATLASLPGGRRTIEAAFGHTAPPPELAGTVAGVAVVSRLGAVVPPGAARDAVRALPTQGAGLIVVAPVGPDDVDVVRRAAAGRRCPVLVPTADPAVAAALTPHVDAVLTTEAPSGGAAGAATVELRTPAISAALAALSDPATAVLATPAVLVEAGPGWFQRVSEAATPTDPAPGPRETGLRDLARREVGLDPRRWPAWWWGACAGIGMICAGLGAAAITLGPVLLWYDRGFLGLDREGLHGANHHLVPFLQHDRITMAATMVTLGVLYTGLAAGGIRRGWPWARTAYLASGAIAFPTLFYFLAFGFVEPLHTAVAATLFPMFVLAVRRRPPRPRWTIMAEGPEPQRRRALLGQLLLIVTGVGLFAGGAVVSAVGLTHVFVPSDLAFLQTTSGDLRAVNPRLLPFIAHDRAGFGGALMAAAVAITLLTAWGWRRGEAWLWWSLALAAVAGFVPPVAVHAIIGYTDFWHLAPVYVGIVLTAAALALARSYLCARR
ncbi:hypothetical protein GCM10023085_23570 [Actinomadura viridis]|uniref:Uncharacterized protein n=1 Tax=Actinomadura viridis TaxID=58110 RepID=A0A931GIX9_9ACTN|nr:hypothetical protein [Actinomadura viridis]MBG6088730.1 hypothetical protein [Actinomadura viridis]